MLRKLSCTTRGRMRLASVLKQFHLMPRRNEGNFFWSNSVNFTRIVTFCKQCRRCNALLAR
jgi:hypothetical protein